MFGQSHVYYNDIIALIQNVLYCDAHLYTCITVMEYRFHKKIQKVYTKYVFFSKSASLLMGISLIPLLLARFSAQVICPLNIHV